MRETYQVRRGRCRNDNTFCDFYFAAPELRFCEYRCFRKPAKYIVSPPTSTLPYDNRRDTPYLRNRRSTMEAGVIRPRPESTTTTRPEPLPPPFGDPMDFIGSCEWRWKRNEVAKSNKKTAGEGLKKHEQIKRSGLRACKCTISHWDFFFVNSTCNSKRNNGKKSVCNQVYLFLWNITFCG